ncbi:MAG: hypothetical protein IKC87_05275 [Clostridia bacterium]|nr:hypothetical protein [Clostridia bacterium]
MAKSSVFKKVFRIISLVITGAVAALNLYFLWWSTLYLIRMLTEGFVDSIGTPGLALAFMAISYTIAVLSTLGFISNIRKLKED